MAEIKKITLANGKTRYRFVIDIGHDENGRRKQLTVTKDTATEAKNELARLQHERSTGQLIMPNKVTVSELLNLYMASKADDLEETSIVGYRNSLVHVHTYLGHKRLQELTEDDVESMVAWLLVSARRRGGKPGTGLRTITASGVLGRLRTALNYGIRRRLIARNVAEHISIPRKARKVEKRESPRAAPWNVVEVKEFILGVRDDRLFGPLLLSLMGLRPAEVSGLRWDDVDFEAGTLSVANTRTLIGNARVVEKDTKSEAGERTLPLPDPVRLALLNFKVLQAAEAATAGEGYTSGAYVFVDPLGTAMNGRLLREHAYALMAGLGLRKVRLYDARHSCLTFLAVNGVPDTILAAWAGHTNANFTKRVYVHPTAADMHEAVVHLNALLGVGSDASDPQV
ncbi:integrase [Streptomyces sp. WM4235]|uniref:tyrosine-type recombinase/integrase n=1 Tax=Streptomyces sp. WM4235 TaxID=1415551 RepID=UPI0006C1DBB8|nr:tyrosine-type recombinase/integrase [Streptomyces sp. WM4235]KOU62502.1 integrase [Streptomyces sp. WM4235]